MHIFKYLIAGLTALAILSGCEYWPAHCPQHFFQEAVPELTSAKLERRTARLCYDEFAVLHSGISRTPLWSAEHLTDTQIDWAKSLKRKNVFHPEDRLFPWNRAELEDYAHSGLDRGHMSPSGDMSTEPAQYESFTLANIVPQQPKNNQVLWAGIEESTRNLVRERGQLYVVTGPIFEGTALRKLNGRVLVPSHVFKAIYDPVRQQGAAYIAANSATWNYEMVSIAALEKRIQINLFPRVSVAAKQTAMELPEPRPYSHRGQKHAPLSDARIQEK